MKKREGQITNNINEHFNLSVIQTLFPYVSYSKLYS